MLDITDSTAVEQMQKKRHTPMAIPNTNRSGSNNIFNNPRIAVSPIHRVFNRSIPSAMSQVPFVNE